MLAIYRIGSIAWCTEVYDKEGIASYMSKFLNTARCAQRVMRCKNSSGSLVEANYLLEVQKVALFNMGMINHYWLYVPTFILFLIEYEIISICRVRIIFIHTKYKLIRYH